MRKFVKYTFVAFTILVALGLIASYICVYINPSKFWFSAPVGLIYPPLVLVSVLLMFFWIRYKKWKVVLSLFIIIVAGYNSISKTLQFNVSNELEQPGDLLFMTYNVKLFDFYNFDNNIESRNSILQTLNEQNPDILCMQEFYYDSSNKFSTLDTILSSLKYPYHHTAYFTVKFKYYHYGIVTFSRYPIVRKETIRFPDSDNLSIVTDILFNSDTIRVFNNHLQSIRLNYEHYSTINTVKDSLRFNWSEIKSIGSMIKKGYAKRGYQADSIGGLIADSPYKTIVCGDFNEVPVSYTYKKICTDNDLNDAFVESGFGMGGTYAGNLPNFRIDYVLHSKSIQATDYKVLKLRVSDHYPVTCKLSTSNL